MKTTDRQVKPGCTRSDPHSDDYCQHIYYIIIITMAIETHTNT